MSKTEDTLNTISGHITSAFTAVSDAGGTVPASPNLSKLSAAVETIPQSTDDFGTVTYYTQSTRGYVIGSNSNMRIVSIDEERLWSQLGSRYPYNDECQFAYIVDPMMGQEGWVDPDWQPTSQEDILASFGVELECTSESPMEGGYITFSRCSVPTSAQTTTGTILNQTEITSMNNNSYTTRVTVTVEGQSVPISLIKSITLGASAKSLPTYFLNNAPYLESIDLSGCNENINIGSSAFAYLLALTSVNVGNLSASIIGTSSRYCFTTDYPYGVSYTEKVALSGANAQAWKNALPDYEFGSGYSSPYRRTKIAN